MSNAVRISSGRFIPAGAGNTGGGGSSPREASAQQESGMSAGTEIAQADSKMAPGFSLTELDGGAITLDGPRAIGGIIVSIIIIIVGLAALLRKAN